ncbi:MAG: bifunctional DNA-formamidopyrimidine glycosylase/DNA-(apurinic or apyrimidinic site) lyase [Pseudomonadota bacterium]
MPELPEVETTRRGVEPLLVGRTATEVHVFERRLRQPVSRGLAKALQGQRLMQISRRAKYLLFGFETGTLISHLGMSGTLRVVDQKLQRQTHDHVDITFDDSRILRFRDPRRFGLMLWTANDPYQHRLLAPLGPEPWDPAFSARYLKQRAAQRTTAIKNFIMDAHTVVGVGNIYASESLHRAGINPRRKAGSVSLARYSQLVVHIQAVLEAAIKAGGTTLRDFVNNEGKPGYFRANLRVYDRAGEPCLSCGTAIRSIVIGQRSTYYCPRCQRS